MDDRFAPPPLPGQLAFDFDIEQSEEAIAIGNSLRSEDSG
jgi:hypothetical protein